METLGGKKEFSKTYRMDNDIARINFCAETKRKSYIVI